MGVRALPAHYGSYAHAVAPLKSPSSRGFSAIAEIPVVDNFQTAVTLRATP